MQISAILSMYVPNTAFPKLFKLQINILCNIFVRLDLITFNQYDLIETKVTSQNY